MIKTYFLAILIFFNATELNAASLEVITVIGKGSSDNRSDAVARALVEAVGKVNPSAISALDEVKKRSQKAVLKSNEMTESTSLRTSDIKREFSQATKGVVKSWEIVSEEINSKQQFQVTISADIFKLKDSKQLSRKKITVLSKDGGDHRLNEILKVSIEESLIKSRKFAVLQDNSSAEIHKFVNNIREKGRIEDLVRIQGTAAPEVILIVSVGPLSESSGRLRGNINLEVVDYSSGQVQYQNSLPILLRNNDIASAQRRVETMGGEITKQLLAHIFPPLVVGWNGELMTIGLGDSFFNVGDLIKINESIGALEDLYTGEYLEENLKTVCIAEIRDISARVSIAAPREFCGSPFLEGSTDKVSELNSRMFIVTRIKEGDEPSIFSATSSNKTKSKKTDFDGLFKTDH